MHSHMGSHMGSINNKGNEGAQTECYLTFPLMPTIYYKFMGHKTTEMWVT
jgi:hypothetical protein